MMRGITIVDKGSLVGQSKECRVLLGDLDLTDAVMGYKIPDNGIGSLPTITIRFRLEHAELDHRRDSHDRS